jgi:hypothetical protein
MTTGTTVELQEADDGELFLEIPDDIFELLGWDNGTVIQWDIVGDGIRISKAPDDAIGEVLLPEQSRVDRGLPSLSAGGGGVQSEDAEVVGEPSF